MNLLKKVREELEKPVAILLDTKGPESVQAYWKAERSDPERK